MVGNSEVVLAAYWANWYPHVGEAWIDMAMGCWTEPEYSNHVTFACSVGSIGDEPGSQCSLVQAAEFRSDAAMFGSKRSRHEALSHAWLPTFWVAIDWLMLNDPLLHERLFHMGEPQWRPCMLFDGGEFGPLSASSRMFA